MFLWGQRSDRLSQVPEPYFSHAIIGEASDWEQANRRVAQRLQQNNKQRSHEKYDTDPT